MNETNVEAQIAFYFVLAAGQAVTACGVGRARAPTVKQEPILGCQMIGKGIEYLVTLSSNNKTENN